MGTAFPSNRARSSGPAHPRGQQGLPCPRIPQKLSASSGAHPGARCTGGIQEEPGPSSSVAANPCEPALPPTHALQGSPTVSLTVSSKCFFSRESFCPLQPHSLPETGCGTGSSHCLTHSGCLTTLDATADHSSRAPASKRPHCADQPVPALALGASSDEMRPLRSQAA